MSCFFCKFQEFFQNVSMEEVNCKLTNLLILGDQIMATIQEVKDAVLAEAAEVKSRVDTLEAEIQALKDSMANGGTITEAQLDEVLVAVQGIFAPLVAPDVIL